MPPKRKHEETATRRSSRNPAALKTSSPMRQKKEPAVKRAKVSGSKEKTKDNEIELLSPRRRAASSKKENVDDGKVKPEKKKVSGASSPAGKIVAPPADDKDESENDETLLELKTTKKHGKVKVAKEDGSPASLPNPTRTIFIEACTQCKSFKERADKVKNGLENAIPGISVMINPQKPRRGYFEISEQKTEVILSLPSMNRPFKPMKALNMDEVVKDLIKRFK